MVNFIPANHGKEHRLSHLQGRAFKLSIPTAEHFLPLLYTLAMKESNDIMSLFNDKNVAGSFAMASVKLEMPNFSWTK